VLYSGAHRFEASSILKTLPPVPARRCITDRRRTRRELYIRLETWLARIQWETFGAGNFSEADAVRAVLHFVHHLRTGRPPCPICPQATLELFEKLSRVMWREYHAAGVF
jgi:hypothetical protein